MGKNFSVCFSHLTDDWSTPKDIYEYFEDLKCFDPCPLRSEKDGLNIPWKRLNFVNPPYSNIGAFVDKAILEANDENVTFLLVPSRTDQSWFVKLINYGCAFLFFNGRLKFGNAKGNAPFPSVLIVIAYQIEDSVIRSTCNKTFKVDMDELLKRYYLCE